MGEIYKIKEYLYIYINGKYAIHKEGHSSCRSAVCCNFYVGDDVCDFSTVNMMGKDCPQLSVDDYLKQNPDIKELVNLKLEELKLIDL